MKYLVHALLVLITLNECIANEKIPKQTNWMKFESADRMSVAELISNKKQLSLTEDDDLRLLTHKEDQLGFTHYKYQQMHCGIPIEQAVYTFHTKNNRVYKANGNLAVKVNIDASNTPTLTESVALNKALKFMNADLYAWENEDFESAHRYSQNDESASFYPKGELVWLNADDYKLAYKFEIYAVNPHSRKIIYIDATDGSVLKTVEKIHSCTPTNASGITNYSGSVDFMACKNNNSYMLKNSSDSDIQVFDSNSSHATPLNPIIDVDGYFNTDKTATEVYWASIKAKEYFLSTFNRNSINDEGMPMLSWVHYTNRFNEGANAYWNGSWMLYGDGDNNRYTSFTSPDIVAHEITHGITDFSANLFNIGESGALNESFSDIFGIAFKAHCKAENNWIIGSDIAILPGKNGIRNLSNPNDETMMQVQPNTYKGNSWISSMYDNGGVHINSGVQNYWFYLLSEGGQGVNDNGDNYEIEGIGMDKALQVAYRNLNYYLTSNAQYADARNGAIEAASDLYGENSFEMNQTAAAWCAVGVGANCDTTATNINLCSYTDSLALVAVYNQLNVDNWEDSWNLNEPMEQWTGVSLNENRCVIKLEIDGRGISGSIANEIANLTHLERIDLSENFLSGSIPSSIADLKTLKSIALHYNELSGEIPASLGKLYTLESLYLGNNQLSGTIPSFRNNFNLKSLLLNNNQLEGIISSNVI